MSKSVKVDLTVVSPPDIYCPTSGPKIFFCGAGQEWKNYATSHIEDNWDDWPACNSITVYHDSGKLSDIDWSIATSHIVSNTICYVGPEDDCDAYMSFLLGILSNDENTIFIIGDESPSWVLKLLNAYKRGILVESVEGALELICAQWNTQFTNY